MSPSQPIVTAPRVMVPIPAKKIAAAEARLGFRFPSGYREFMARYGEAFFSNDLRIYGPTSVVDQNEEWRLGEGDSFFWPNQASALGRDQERQCIRYADTIFGDQLAVHPAIQGASFLFPRSSETIHRFDGGLVETLDWVLSAGICLAPSRSRYVEPLDELPAYSADWCVDKNRRAPSYEEAIDRVAALDARSRVLRDIVAGAHRAEIFLPQYETRVRIEMFEDWDRPGIQLISFLADKKSKAKFRRALEAAGVEDLKAG